MVRPSADGGMEEFRGLRFNRASKSATLACSVAIVFCNSAISRSRCAAISCQSLATVQVQQLCTEIASTEARQTRW
ncbi:MAG: hypothetical protein ACRDOE_02865 [Streptosporangiaceae bacterium]